ncbi:MAG: cupin domain-containing protein [Thermodesulfobacteriota bacterium]
MNENSYEQKLREEGFSGVFIHRDRPNGHYPDHTHHGTTAHVVIEGLITVTSGGNTVTYGPGERFDVPAGAVHSAIIGPEGCLYVIGEK